MTVQGLAIHRCVTSVASPVPLLLRRGLQLSQGGADSAEPGDGEELQLIFKRFGLILYVYTYIKDNMYIYIYIIYIYI